MKVYFNSSGRGYEKFGKFCEQIYIELENLGCEHLDDALSNTSQERFYAGGEDEKKKEYSKVIKSIREADVIVIELSEPSITMGFVLDKALESSKPVIALYYKDNLPHFANIVNNEKLQVISYDESNIKAILQSALEYAKDLSDTRFNFFISPRHSEYLDWIARHKRIPRSVFLRNLIEDDMAADTDYSQAA